MFAVIKTGGKQYSVESGKTLKIEKVATAKAPRLNSQIVNSVPSMGSVPVNHCCISSLTVSGLSIGNR